jgi:segregation and condensation protein A
MTEEENILQMIIEKESWEEVIYYIVSVENLDPWNIDLVKLTDSFIRYLKAVEELDFRIPAKIVFVAAILLKLKADYLSIFEEREESVEEPKTFEDLGIDSNLVQLSYPMKRVPKRQVTLDELINALRKAMAVEKRREERKQLFARRLQVAIPTEEDITKRIERVMQEIDELMKKLNLERIEFKQIVEEWKRDKIVEHFIPVLHLDQERKIEIQQPEIFKEIWISKKR